MQIGVAANFTDPLSLPIRYGAQLAAEEINAAGGINGRPIELVEREDYADADSAVVVATDFYNSPVVAVIGHGFSGPTLAAAPVYNGGSNPLLEIAPAASAPAVTDAGPYTFRLCPSDLAHGSALARWARERLGLTRGAVFYTNSEYGRGIRTAFEAEFASLDGAVVGSYPYLGDTPDVGPYVDLLSRDKRAQFMLIAGYDPDARTILTEARKKNLTIPAMGGDGLELEVRQLVRGNEPAEDLIAVANETDADLIVIGLRRRTPVGKLILGSNAQRILLDAPCAVLAVKG